jgi:CRP/FNR family cyclic AMP-dependent transcriptional regulator
MDAKQKVAALAAVPLFAQVGKADLEKLAATAVERHFAAGATVVKEGERGVAMFVIVSGNAEAVKGDSTKLAEYGPGGFFGEMALFESFPRSATVRATSDLECLALTEWDFQSEVRSNPAVALQLLKAIARRLRDTNVELAAARGQAVPPAAD